MGYEWLATSLENLVVGIEPHEVVRVLTAARRWPRAAIDPETGITVLTIWGRTQAGRPLIVAARQVGAWNWQIVGARELSVDELMKFEQWEAQ